MFMGTGTAWKGLYDSTLAKARRARFAGDFRSLNDRVRRVLRVKVRASIFDKPGRRRGRLADNSQSSDRPIIERFARRRPRIAGAAQEQGQLLPLPRGSTCSSPGTGGATISPSSRAVDVTWQGTGGDQCRLPMGNRFFGNREAG